MNSPARASGCRRSGEGRRAAEDSKGRKQGVQQGAHPDRAQQRPLKACAALRGGYHGKTGRLARSLDVITGLANLHRLTGSPDPANTPRMGKKPGPKTSRNIYLQSHGTSARKGRRTGAGRRHSCSKQAMPPPFRRVTSFRLGQSRALQARRPSAFGRLERPPSKAGDRLCISSNDLNHTAPAAPTNPPQDDSSCTATTHVNSYIAPATAP